MAARAGSGKLPRPSLNHYEKDLGMTSFDSTPSSRHEQPAGAIARSIPANETYLTAEDLARRYPGVAERTIDSWRSVNAKRVGPPFIRVGLRVYYPLSLLTEWERDNLTVMVKQTTH
jgi:hypothetical protein